MNSKDILEVGAGWPYFFTALLLKERADAKITAISHGVRATPDTHQLGSHDFNITFERATCNIETEDWPIAAECYDAVLLMEVLEHLRSIR